MRWDDAVTHTPEIRAGGTPQMHVATGASHTALAAGVEMNEYYYNLARTVQWATGALATQRFVRYDAPTIAFVGASTCALAATMYISGPPIAGANCTLTQGHPLWIDSGEIRLDSAIAIDAGEGDAVLGKMPTGFAEAQNEWLVIHTQNGRRVVPCFAPA